MSVEPNAARNTQAPAWDHTDCPGTTGCPPRCPRFFDDTGASLLVRPYKGDREALVEFYDAYPSRHRSLSLPPLTRPQIEDWVDRLVERGKNILAFDGEELIGHVAYSPREATESELVIFVAEEYHGRGLGTELCQQAIAHAAADGHTAMHLDVEVSNAPAIGLYTSCGFEEVERTDATITMELTIDESVSEKVQAPPADRL